MFFNKHPKKGFIYAVTAGTFLGELFVYVEKTKNSYSFLSLPDMKIRDVPLDKFEFGLKNSILEPVKRLPRDIYNTCIKQFNKNKQLI